MIHALLLHVGSRSVPQTVLRLNTECFRFEGKEKRRKRKNNVSLLIVIVNPTIIMQHQDFHLIPSANFTCAEPVDENQPVTGIEYNLYISCWMSIESPYATALRGLRSRLKSGK